MLGFQTRMEVDGFLQGHGVNLEYTVEDLDREAASSRPVWERRQAERVASEPVFRILKTMDVQLTPDQKAFARRAIESGRLHSEQDAVQEALALWEERERQRAEFLLTLDDAKALLARGEGRIITPESMRQLAQEVKERGRARLVAELWTKGP